MSTQDSLILVANAVKDTVSGVTDASAVHEVAQVLVQNTATVVTGAVGKGGFSANASFWELVEFQLTGLIVVFVVLGGLTVMCYLIGWALKTIAPDQYYGKTKARPEMPRAAAATPAPANPAAAPVVAGVHPGLSDEKLVAILAVAATEGMGKPVSVVMFRPMNSLDWTWSVQGRVGLHTSHKL